VMGGGPALELLLGQIIDRIPVSVRDHLPRCRVMMVMMIVVAAGSATRADVAPAVGLGGSAAVVAVGAVAVGVVPSERVPMLSPVLRAPTGRVVMPS
jgi:hypothetical protein